MAQFSSFNSGAIRQYTLTTGFDISTASDDQVTVDLSDFISVQNPNPTDIFFKPDGTKLYVGETVTDKIHQFTLSTPFDLSSASYDSVTYSEYARTQGFAFSPDGTTLYTIVESGREIRQNPVITAWDLSTALGQNDLGHGRVEFNLFSQTQRGNSITFNNDGSKFFVLGGINSTVFEYNIPLDPVRFNLMPSTFVNTIENIPVDTFQLGVGIKLDAIDESGNYLSVGAKTKPTYSGAVINYDSVSTFEQAVLGTDYTYNQPNSNQIVFTPLLDADFNIKIT
jgi:hypothetical protein